MDATGKFLIFIAIGLTLQRCVDDSLDDFDPLQPRLVAFDESNVPSTSFNADSNITLALNLINTSSTDKTAGTYYDYCALYDVSEFLLVYKREVSDRGDVSWLPVGKAFVSPIYCATIGIPVLVLANSEQTVCGARWTSNPANVPLGVGEYYTALSHEIEIGGRKLVMDLRLEFQIRK